MVSLENKKKVSLTVMLDRVVNYYQAFIDPVMEINLQLDLIILFSAVI